jgi:alpha-D-ribose 1-methylphosphonate 5-triphosphate diphosphatase
VISRGPALSAGLDDRGSIAVGLRGDLLRVRELDGQPVVRAVFVGGERVS